MASYRGHLMLAAPLGALYGTLPLLRPELDWGPAVLGAGLCTLGGLLPDLDSDSGVPVRELFGLLAAVVPAFLYPVLREAGLPFEQALALLAGLYVFIRYGLSAVFKRWTVHRGMFHSIPALLIAGLLVFLLYPGNDPEVRVYLAGAVMLGYLSHLLLDELCSVDFMGLRIRLNKYAGSALKFGSPSRSATIVAYLLLAGLCYCAWAGGSAPDWLRRPFGAMRPSWLPEWHARR
jgi:membrane-bound metal-dependent hydrolase YbcI (DUF457 family)